MSTYLDTSALAKLIVAETETAALREWLSDHRDLPLVTSSIGAVELQRLAARVSQQASSAAVRLLARLDVISLTPGSLATAAQLPPPEVRTLDALHLASAAELSDLQALVTHDHRMAAAGLAYGLPVSPPDAENAEPRPRHHRARQLIGFEPKVGLDEILAMVVEDQRGPTACPHAQPTATAERQLANLGP